MGNISLLVLPLPFVPVLIILIVPCGILRRRFAAPRGDAGIAGAGCLPVARTEQFDAELPLVAVVEEEEEFLLARLSGKRHIADQEFIHIRRFLVIVIEPEEIR